VTLLVQSSEGYANLSRLLTAAHAGTRPKEGAEVLPPSLDRHLLAQLNGGLVCLSGCARHGLAVRNPNGAAELAAVFGRERFFVELQRPYERGDARRNARLRDLARMLDVETIATGDTHAHNAVRARLQDAMVAIKHRTSLEGAERERRGNHESVLLAPAAAAERWPDDLDAVARTAELAERLEFDLTAELGYRYPDFSDRDIPAERQLAAVCERAFEARYGGANGHKRRARVRLDE
jgi:error-prone DNA polymerase